MLELFAHILLLTSFYIALKLAIPAFFSVVWQLCFNQSQYLQKESLTADKTSIFYLSGNKITPYMVTILSQSFIRNTLLIAGLSGALLFHFDAAVVYESFRAFIVLLISFVLLTTMVNGIWLALSDSKIRNFIQRTLFVTFDSMSALIALWLTVRG